MTERRSGAYAVLFKIFFWDEIVAAQYERVCANAPGGDVFLVCDVSRGRVALPDHIDPSRVFEISEAMLPDYGLHNHLGFWFCADYPLYLFFLARPDYGHYIAIEYDVAVFNDLDGIVQAMEAETIDFVARPLLEHNAGWNFIGSCAGYYDIETVQKALVCVAFHSRRMVAAGLRRRLLQNSQRIAANLEHWPVSEVIFSTEARLLGFRSADLADFCSQLDNYNWMNGITEAYLAFINTERTFVHPICDRRKATRTTFGANGDWLRRSTSELLNKAIANRDFEFFCRAYHLPDNGEADRAAVLDAMMAVGDRLLDAPSWFLGTPVLNVARCTQSSVSDYSFSADEAARAYNRLPRFGFSFHTNHEDAPWWMLELDAPTFVSSLHLIDRPDVLRSQHLCIAVGDEPDRLETVFINEGDPIPPASAGGLTVRLNRRLRFVRVFLLDHSMLHFDSLLLTVS